MEKRLITVITLLALVLLATPTLAQSTLQTVYLLQEGFFRAYRNELALDTKLSFRDPVKIRMGAWWTDSYLAIVSGDLLSGDESSPRRDERGFFGIRHNDSYAKEYNAQEFVVNLTDPGCSGQDACQKTRFRLTTDALEVFGRRIEWNTGTVGDHLTGGAYGLYMQSDGNLVIYSRVGETPCPFWALTWIGSYYRNGTGYIDPAVLDPPCR